MLDIGDYFKDLIWVLEKGLDDGCWMELLDLRENGGGNGLDRSLSTMDDRKLNSQKPGVGQDDVCSGGVVAGSEL